MVLRQLIKDNKVPGAGKYHDDVKISGVGKYTNSKYKGGTQAKFQNSRRFTYFDAAVKSETGKPGPGNYKTPSEFGQYDGNVYGNMEAGRFASRK